MSEAPVILAIETATRICGAAVAGPAGLIAEAVVSEGLSHSSRLIGLVRRVLGEASMSPRDVDAIAVSAGPGSFTGIRIGMGTALGLAAGADLPVIAVPTLDALAAGQRPFEGLVCPFIDARRGEVYFCFYEVSGHTMERLAEYSVRPPAAMAAGLLNRIGRGKNGPRALLAGPASVLRDAEINGLAPGRLSIAGPDRSSPGAASVAALGVELYLAGEAAGPESLRPIYVRRSDAEVGKPRKR